MTKRNIEARIKQLEDEKQKLEERKEKQALSVLKQLLRIGTPKEEGYLREYYLGSEDHKRDSGGHETYNNHTLYIRGKSLLIENSCGYNDFHGGRETGCSRSRTHALLYSVKQFKLCPSGLDDILVQIKKDWKKYSREI